MENSGSQSGSQSRKQNQNWFEKNQRLIKIGMIILTLLISGFNVYLQVMKDMERASDPFGLERDPDLTDERFEQAWMRTFVGKWQILEVGGFVEFTSDNRVIITFPDGQIEERGYAYFGPMINSGTILVMWGAIKNGPPALPRFMENLGVGLIGPDLALWDSGFITDSETGEITEGFHWQLKRVDSAGSYAPVVPTTGKSYLAYVCDKQLGWVKFDDGEERLQYDICIANPDGSQARKVTTDAIKSTQDVVAVDSNGRVVFHCFIEGWETELCVTEPHGGPIQPIPTDPNYWFGYITVNNRGDAIAMCADRRIDIKSRRNQVCFFNLDGSGFSVLTNDQRSRIRPHDGMRLLINESGQYAFRCFDHGNTGESEVCTVGEDKKLVELTTERERPRFFYFGSALGPDGSIIYTCSEDSDWGQLCRFDPGSNERESITYWAGMPYWNVTDIDVNNHGQVVFRCWNHQMEGQHICGSQMGEPGFWDLTRTESALSFSKPRINDAGDVISKCVEREKGKNIRWGTCNLAWDGTGVVEWLNLEIPMLGSSYGRGDEFYLSR